MRGHAAGGRDNTSRQVAASTTTSPHVTLLLEKKRRWLEACNETLVEQKKMRAALAEMEGAQKTKTNATIPVPKKDSKAEVQLPDGTSSCCCHSRW
jgi:hypothetical protein